jgi:hypothetical protein
VYTVSVWKDGASDGALVVVVGGTVVVVVVVVVVVGGTVVVVVVVGGTVVVVVVGADVVVVVVAPDVVVVVEPTPAVVVVVVPCPALAALSSIALNSSFIVVLITFNAATEGRVMREAIRAYSTRAAPVWLRSFATIRDMVHLLLLLDGYVGIVGTFVKGYWYLTRSN